MQTRVSPLVPTTMFTFRWGDAIKTRPSLQPSAGISLSHHPCRLLVSSTLLSLLNPSSHITQRHFRPTRVSGKTREATRPLISFPFACAVPYRAEIPLYSIRPRVTPTAIFCLSSSSSPAGEDIIASLAYQLTNLGDETRPCSWAKSRDLSCTTQRVPFFVKLLLADPLAL
jgi:hypothetical protein